MPDCSSQAAVVFHVRVYVTKDAPPEGAVPCYRGRPNLVEIMAEARQRDTDGKIAALACGPAQLVKDAMTFGRTHGMHCHFETFLL